MSVERNNRILIVDDTRSIHEDFRKILARPSAVALEGEEALFGPVDAPDLPRYELTSAFQGQDALRAVQEAKEARALFALAFVDMRMPPGWDGLETIERLWQVDPELQVVMCTAYSDYTWEHIVARFGTLDKLLILKKPFDTVEVAQLACSLTAKWHLGKHAHLKLNQLQAMVDEQTRALEASNTHLRAEVIERSKSQEALRASEERFALAANGSNDGLWDWDFARGVTYYSPRWREMLGLDESRFLGTIEEWFALVHEDDRAAVRELLDGHLSGATPQFVSQHRVQHAQKGFSWVLCRGIAVRGGEGRALRIAGSQTDVTDRVMVEDQLRHDALHDALTGLPNRALLIDRLGRCLHASRRGDHPLFAVLYIDLDHFKVINDSLGHLVGDELLKAVSHRLSGAVRASDTMAIGRGPRNLTRLGGDEFVLLCEGLRDPADAVRIAERMNAALAVAFDVGGNEIHTSASTGIALSSPAYERAEDLLRDADTALYHAKAAGRGCYRIFDDKMHADAVQRWRLENELRRAIEGGELVLHYQPIVDLRTLQVLELEALVRWRHPVRGMVPPGDFIPIAEESGLIVPLDSWVLNEAAQQLRRWTDDAPTTPWPRVAVNMAGRDLARPDLVDEIRRVLIAANHLPERLRIEIMETAIMDTGSGTLDRLRALRELGVELHLDDFGTGHSSLAYLHKLPVSVLKIDRSFVSSMATDPMSYSIVQTIIMLGHSLGMKVTAEGVETRLQHEELIALGCDHGQGYFFHRPMPAGQVEDLISRPPGGARAAAA